MVRRITLPHSDLSVSSRLAVIKLAVAAVGMILGALFASFVLDTLWLFVAIWVIAAACILWITY